MNANARQCGGPIRLHSRPLALAVLLLFITVPLMAQSRATSRDEPSRLVVFAEDSEVADMALFEAKNINEDFKNFFGIRQGSPTIPIVVVLGAKEGSVTGSRDGAVRVFGKPGGLKLQVNWDVLPVTHDSFLHGWTRALCVREVLQARSSNSKASTDLRLPLWFTEGVAVLLSDPFQGQAHWGRATLFARAEPDLSLDEALSLIEGKQDLTPLGRSIAGVLCQAIFDEKRTSESAWGTLNWNREMTARKWLDLVVKKPDLQLWWNGVWQHQREQFAWVKLGYVPSLHWILKLQAGTEASMGENSPTARPSNLNLGPVINPWFKSWTDRFTKGEDPSRRELVELRTKLEIRRGAAIEWFDELISQSSESRSDLLLWERLNRSAAGTSQEKGPREAWFDSVQKKLAPKS